MLTKKQRKLSKLFVELEEYQEGVKDLEEQIDSLMAEKEPRPKKIKNTRANRKKGIPPDPEDEPAPKRWAQGYDCCLMCKSAEHPYKSNGLCIKCYRTDRGRILKNGGSVKDFPIVRKQKNSKDEPAQRQFDEPKSSAVFDYNCENCSEGFRSVFNSDIEDVRCPQCNSMNTVKI